MSEVYDLYFDGSTLPNSGESKVGCVIVNENGDVVHTRSLEVGYGTNNYAEIMALYVGLQDAYRLGYTKVNVYGDSRMVIDAMNDQCGLRNSAVLGLYLQILTLTTDFDWVSYTWVPRNTGYHQLADKLSKF